MECRRVLFRSRSRPAIAVAHRAQVEPVDHFHHKARKMLLGKPFIHRWWQQISCVAVTRLVRDWHGKPHQVLIRDDGFVYQDRVYRSLSHIARAITGSNWSGPRFFGLARRTRMANG